MGEQPYERLKFYQDICEIRQMTAKITDRFDKKHMRLISQMRDAARSSKQNIGEGYRRGTLATFLNGIRISRGSLEELSGDMQDCLEDGLITREEFDKFSGLYSSASYMSAQYLRSMSRSANKAKWRTVESSKLTPT